MKMKDNRIRNKIRSPNPFRCKVKGCIDNRIHGHGYCRSHYERWYKGRKLEGPINHPGQNLLCIVEGCGKKRAVTIGYCNSHHSRFKRGRPIEAPLQQRKNNNLTFDGYVEFGINGVTKSEHRLLAEKALGKPLPKGVEVHHVNGIRWDNRPENLVVCPNRAYHELIEQRTRAFEACGHADWLRCSVCKEYDDPSNFRFCKKSTRNDNRTHRGCSKIPLVYRIKIEEMNSAASAALSFGS